jgi:NADH:ubiquinone oxidoreductase subunit C
MATDSKAVEKIVEDLKKKFGDKVVTKIEDQKEPPVIVVALENFLDVMKTLRDPESYDFNMLMSQSGVDILPDKKKKRPAPKAAPAKDGEKKEENSAEKASEASAENPAKKLAEKTEEESPDGHLESVYHLWCYQRDEEIAVKVELDKKSPSIPSVVEIWSNANWFERETFDMMGIRFEGHPDLRRILCPPDWEGYPLRKDYETQKTWRDIVVAPKSKSNPWLRNLDPVE